MKPTKLLKTGDICPCCRQPINTTRPDVLYVLSWINEIRRLPGSITELCQVMSDFNEVRSEPNFEPPTLNEEERTMLLQLWDWGYRWIARSGPGHVLAFEAEPTKSMGIWTPATWKTAPVPDLGDKLPWLFSDDPAATPLSWLLGKVEGKP